MREDNKDNPVYKRYLKRLKERENRHKIVQDGKKNHRLNIEKESRKEKDKKIK